jgi:apolipoprotein N-acyltransferase
MPNHMPFLPDFSAVHARLLLLVSLLFLIIAAGVGYNMYQLGQAELLWGYRPLWILLGGWLGLIGLWQWRKLRKSTTLPSRPLVLSTLSGLLLGVGFPDIVPLPFLLMVGWVPLLLLIEDWKQKEGAKKRELLPYLLHTFMLWNIIATYWVMNTSFAAGIFANFANSLLMSIPFMLFLWTQKYIPKMGYGSLIAYWLTFEYVHLSWELTWPWLTLGNGWAEYPSLVQWYEYTGVFGGSLWIWVVNIMFLNILIKTQREAAQKLPNWRHWWKTAAVLTLPMLVSVVMYTNYQEQGAAIDVVLVQPNFEPHYEKFERIEEAEQITRFITLSQPLLDEQVDYLVFPETSYGFVEENDVISNRSTRRLMEAFGAYPTLKLVTGLNAYHDFLPDEPRTAATRTRNRGGQIVEYEMMNLAAQIPMNPEEEAQTYRKSKLVPGPEKFPFKKILFFLEPLVDNLGGTTAGLGIQDKRSAFTSEAARVAPVICYESVFGGYFAGYVVDGKAQAAFIMTNDGWWDNTAGHRQHLHFASLRAIETRRSIGRSANTGISAFINQRGDISQATQYNEPIAIRGQMLLNDEVTFYVKWRDLIARTALFLALLLILNTFVKSRLSANK